MRADWSLFSFMDFGARLEATEDRTADVIEFHMPGVIGFRSSRTSLTGSGISSISGSCDFGGGVGVVVDFLVVACGAFFGLVGVPLLNHPSANLRPSSLERGSMVRSSNFVVIYFVMVACLYSISRRRSNNKTNYVICMGRTI
jgi:hypothetical protein